MSDLAAGKNGMPVTSSPVRIIRPGDAGFPTGDSKEADVPKGVTTKSRRCVFCSKEYVPTGPRQKRCPARKAKQKPGTPVPRDAKPKAEKPSAEARRPPAPVVAAAIASLRTKERRVTATTDSAFDTQVGGDHYKDMAIQPVEFITKNKLSFCAGNVVKYVCRHHVKGGPEDLDKAIHYLQLERETLYGKAAA